MHPDPRRRHQAPPSTPAMDRLLPRSQPPPRPALDTIVSQTADMAVRIINLNLPVQLQLPPFIYISTPYRSHHLPPWVGQSRSLSLSLLPVPLLSPSSAPRSVAGRGSTVWDWAFGMGYDVGIWDADTGVEGGGRIWNGFGEGKGERRKGELSTDCRD